MKDYEYPLDSRTRPKLLKAEGWMLINSYKDTNARPERTGLRPL